MTNPSAPKTGHPHRSSKGVALTLLLLVFALAVAVPSAAPDAHASSMLVQKANEWCAVVCGDVNVPLSLPVTAGDALVVAVAYQGLLPGAFVFDALDSPFQAATYGAPGPDLELVQISYVTLSLSGPDSVTVLIPGPASSVDVFVYEVSGVTTTGYAVASAEGPGPVAQAGPLSFNTGAFVVGAVETELPGPPPLPVPSGLQLASPAGSGYGWSAYSQGGVASPASVSFITGAPGWWSLSAIALQPTTTTSVTCTPSSLVLNFNPDQATCTATVSGVSPTGTVGWSQASADGGSVSFSSASCTLSAGSCSVTATLTTRGTITVTGTYSGDSNNVGSAGTAGISTGVAACPSTFGGTYMPVGSSFTDGFGNSWTAPGGTANGWAYSSYFFPSPEGAIPAPMQQGWGGDFGTYNGQQGWIVTFYC